MNISKVFVSHLQEPDLCLMVAAGFPVHAVTPPSREENVVADINSLSDLKYRIQELLQSTLDHSSITVSAGLRPQVLTFRLRIYYSCQP